MSKKITIMPWTLALSLLLLGGCGAEKKANETDNTALSAYLEPDIYFEKAIEYLEADDIESSLSEIDKAAKFINTIIIKNDSIHANIIEFALGELDDLSDVIINDSLPSTSQLRDVFSSIDLSISRYHFVAIEDWIKNEKNDKWSLERMRRALFRTQYAINHAEIQLTEEEEKELSKAIEDVAKADRASLSLWQRLKATQEKFDRLVQENSNPLDGTF